MNDMHLFIGSSKEQLDVARTVQELLRDDAIGMLWSEGIFGLSKSSLSSLIRTLDQCDAAVFVLAPDDVATIRSKRVDIARDNVIFELGLFMGRLGSSRTFMLAPEKMDDFHLPTDLAGVVLDPYKTNASQDELIHVLGPACSMLRRALREISNPEPSTALKNFLEKIDFSTVRGVSVLAYTGSTTIRTIYEHLDRDTTVSNRNVPMRVALRARHLSDSVRAADIKRTQDLIDRLAGAKPWLKPEIRYYGAPALLRSVLIDHRDGSQSAYLSYYDWNRADTNARRTTSNDMTCSPYCPQS